MTQIQSHTLLKALVVVHFVLTVWAAMGQWLPAAYIYAHASILVFGVWGIIQQESADAMFMFLLLNVISVPLDVIFLGIFQPMAYDQFEAPLVRQSLRNLYRFSLGMAIVNIILKPLTCLVGFRIYQERGGSYSDFNIPVPGFGTHPGQYENIDQPVPTNQVETATPHQTLEKPPPSQMVP